MVPSPSKKRKRRMVDSSNSQQMPQRWYPEEIEDLTRLGSLFSFIGVEPFATLRTKYSSDVMKPLRGDQFGSVQRLHNLMKTLLVRHEYVTIFSLSLTLAGPKISEQKCRCPHWKFGRRGLLSIDSAGLHTTYWWRS